MPLVDPDKVISTILKHDSKITSYKIALLRAINDVVLVFPDLRTYHQDVAVPLRLLAQFWIAYYWPFVDPQTPILQGQRGHRGGKTYNDMAFRPALTELRRLWEQTAGGFSRPADGFLVLNELRSPRKRIHYPATLTAAYQHTLKAIGHTLEQPIRYAGPGEWTVFEKPIAYQHLANRAVAIPGTQPQDKCLVIPAELWQTFRQMSLWVEALCIHEWCLFSEKVAQLHSSVNRGKVYTLLTERPDNRRPLTWERNQVDLLLMEGYTFTCPWTTRCITAGTAYDLDHLIPIAIYPTNELWNLVPADPHFNSHTKRDQLPSQQRLQKAQPYFELAYRHYGGSQALATALQEDVALRFARVQSRVLLPEAIAQAVVNLITEVADSRNLARF